VFLMTPICVVCLPFFISLQSFKINKLCYEWWSANTSVQRLPCVMLMILASKHHCHCNYATTAIETTWHVKSNISIFGKSQLYIWGGYCAQNVVLYTHIYIYTHVKPPKKIIVTSRHIPQSWR
jgi:hypothetical protein